ncbi:SurA N-terminal domain-containing protein [Candidatus Woesearchaeota archaeon]|nr:SurA N-terminal domain-containing protein [Candidatus Woesearchaeota archaeon]
MEKKHIKRASHKKLNKSRAVSKSNKNKFIFLTVAVLLVLAVSYYAASRDKVAATVYGEKIYEKRVDAIYNSLPSDSKISKALILQQIIDMKILVHYAEEQGFGLSDSAFESELKKLLASQNEPIDEFRKNIELWGITMDDYKESMEISIFIKGVLENNAEAAANIIEQGRKTADIVIYSEYK